MSYDPQTFKIIANFAKGHFVDRTKTAVNPPSGYVGDVPDLWAENSFELVVDCYEYYDTAAHNQLSDFGDAASTKLYIKFKNSTDEAVELGSGVVESTGDKYARLRYTVEKGDLPREFAGSDCILYGDVLDSTNHERTWAQDLGVLNEDGTGAITTESSEVGASQETLAVDTILTAFPGRVEYLVDTSGGNVVITLPDPTAYDQQEIELLHISAANTVSVIGTINGDAGPQTLAVRGSAVFIADGSVWYNMNLDTTVP